MELAADLLEVTDEAELDQFLGKLLKRPGAPSANSRGSLARRGRRAQGDRQEGAAVRRRGARVFDPDPGGRDGRRHGARDGGEQALRNGPRGPQPGGAGVRSRAPVRAARRRRRATGGRRSAQCPAPGGGARRRHGRAREHAPGSCGRRAAVRRPGRRPAGCAAAGAGSGGDARSSCSESDDARHSTGFVVPGRGGARAADGGSPASSLSCSREIDYPGRRYFARGPGRDRALSGGRAARVARAAPRIPRLAAGPGGERATPAQAQPRFTILRLRFHEVLSQFDLFADVLMQRSQHDDGRLARGA